MASKEKIYYKDGYKNQLHMQHSIFISIKPTNDIKSDFIELKKDGFLIIKKGYAWDGVTGFPDFKSLRRGALVHDALCQLLREGKLDKKYDSDVDNTLIILFKEDKTSRFFIKPAYFVIKKFGGFAHDTKNKKVIKTN